MKFRSMFFYIWRWLLRIMATAAMMLLLLLLLAVFVVNVNPVKQIVINRTEKEIRTAFGVRISIDDYTFLFPGKIEIRNVSIADSSSYASFNKLSFRLKELSMKNGFIRLGVRLHETTVDLNHLTLESFRKAANDGEPLTNSPGKIRKAEFDVVMENTQFTLWLDDTLQSLHISSTGIRAKNLQLFPADRRIDWSRITITDTYASFCDHSLVEKESRNGKPWAITGKKTSMEDVFFDFQHDRSQVVVSERLGELHLEKLHLNMEDKLMRAGDLIIADLQAAVRMASNGNKKGFNAKDFSFPWNITIDRGAFSKLSYVQEVHQQIPQDSARARTTSLKDLSFTLRSCLMSRDTVQLSVKNLSGFLDPHFDVDEGNVDLYSDKTETDLQFNTLISGIEIDGKLIADIPWYLLPDFDTPGETNSTLRVDNFRTGLLHSYLPDSLFEGRLFPDTKCNLHLEIHKINDWLQIDTLSLWLDSLAHLELKLAVDQIFQKDSLLISGRSEILLMPAGYSWLNLLTEGSLPQLNNKFLEFSNTYFAEHKSVHTRGEIRSENLLFPYEFSLFRPDSSFRLTTEHLNLSLDSILNLPLDIEIDSLNAFGNLGTNRYLHYNAYLPNLRLQDHHFMNLFLTGELAGNSLFSSVTVRDSVLDLAVRFNGQLSDSIRVGYDGAFHYKSDITVREKRFSNLQSRFQGTLLNSEKGIGFELFLDSMAAVSEMDDYVLDQVSLKFTSQPSFVGLNLNGPEISLDFNAQSPMDSLINWYTDRLSNIDIRDSASYWETFNTLPGYELDFRMGTNPLLYGLLFGSRFAFDSLVVESAERPQGEKNARVEIHDFNSPEGGVGSINISTRILPDQLSVESVFSSIHYPNLNSTYLNMEMMLIPGELRSRITAADSLGKSRLFANYRFTRSDSLLVFRLLNDSLVLFGENWQGQANNHLYFSESWIPKGQFTMFNEERVFSFWEDSVCQTKILLKNLQLEKLGRLLPELYLTAGVLNTEICAENASLFDISAEFSIDGLEIDHRLLGDYTGVSEFRFHDSTYIDFNGNVVRNDRKLVDFQGMLDREQPKLSRFSLNLNDLTLSHLQVFLQDQFSLLEGNLSADVNYDGKREGNMLKGALSYSGLSFRPEILNSTFTMRDDSIVLKNRQLMFDHLYLKDERGKLMSIDGYLGLSQNREMTVNVKVRGDSLLIMNVPKARSNEFYGTVIASNELNVRGNLTSPNIRLSLQLLKGTDFTFRPAEDLTGNEGTGTITFVSVEEEDVEPAQQLVDPDHAVEFKASVKIDPSTKLNLVYDRSVSLDITLQGNGNLEFLSIPPQHEIMTGTYGVSRGKAIMKLQGLPPRDFVISPNSNIRWDGLVTDPIVDISAYYRTKGSYVNPVSGAKQTMVADFDVIFSLKNRLSNPDIVFDVRTEDEYMTTILNNMPEEERIRQAINILLLGQIVDENTKITGATLLTDHLNQFWSQQLNEAAAENIQDISLSVDINSYTAYTTAGAEERTDLSYELSKTVLDERATLKVGGYVRTGSHAPNESMNRIIGDVSLEYELSEESNFYAKVFSKYKYEGILEGEIQTAGAGIMYKQNYQSLKEIWQRREKRKTGQSKTDQQSEEPE